MAYCTQSDVELAVGGAERLRQLADWDRDNSVDTDVVANAIEWADGYIDSVISRRYAVPVASPIPVRLKHLSADGAIYKLKKDRGMATEQDVEHFTDVWQKEVEKIGNGQITLGVDPLPTKSSLVADQQVDRPSTKNVGRDQTKGFW